MGCLGQVCTIIVLLGCEYCGNGSYGLLIGCVGQWCHSSHSDNVWCAPHSMQEGSSDQLTSSPVSAIALPAQHVGMWI